jgi:hypothetical protein
MHVNELVALLKGRALATWAADFVTDFCFEGVGCLGTGDSVVVDEVMAVSTRLGGLEKGGVLGIFDGRGHWA